MPDGSKSNEHYNEDKPPKVEDLEYIEDDTIDQLIEVEIADETNF